MKPQSRSGSIPFFHIDDKNSNKLGLAPFYRKTEAGLQPLDFFLYLQRKSHHSDCSRLAITLVISHS